MKSMKKVYMLSISLFISLLIMLIPVAMATELEVYDNIVIKEAEQKINLYADSYSTQDQVLAARTGGSNLQAQSIQQASQSSGSPPSYSTSGVSTANYLDDPGKACVQQHQRSSDFADTLDSSVISTLEKIATVLFTICTVMSAIDVIIDTIATIIGQHTGFCCKLLFCPGPCGVPCTVMEGVFRAWSNVYNVVQPMCCFVNCGWCTGAGCFSIAGIDMSSISLGAIPGGIGQYGLSPYDNIYLAIGCLCPIAVIFNMRKLKTIHDVYNCCIEEACSNGLSTEACENHFDEATCMYWEGSLYSILANVLLSILTKVIAGKLAEVFGLSNLLGCVYALLKLTEVPAVIEGMSSAMDYMGRSFDGVECGDLGFDDIKDEITYDWEYITLVDKDGDQKYDYSSPVWSEPTTKKGTETSTTTLVFWDDKANDGKGAYETKTYTRTKKDGDIMGTIRDENKKEVGLLEWQGLKGEAVSGNIDLYPDGSASYANQPTDSFELANGGIELKSDGKTVFTTDNPKLLGNNEIPGTDYRWSDFDDIDGNKLISGESGEEGYRSVTIGDYDSATGTRRIEYKTIGEDNKPTTGYSELYSDGATLNVHGSDTTFISPEGRDIEIDLPTLISGLQSEDPATVSNSRKAVMNAIESGWTEDEIQSASFNEEDGTLHTEIGSKIRTTGNDKSQIQDTKIVDGIIIKRTESIDHNTGITTVTFNNGEKELTLPEEYAKDIDREEIRFDYSTDTRVVVQTGTDFNDFDVYETTSVGGVEVTTQVSGAQPRYSDPDDFKKGVDSWEHGETTGYMISTDQGNTQISPGVMDKLLEQTKQENIEGIGEGYFKALQQADQRFDGKITPDTLNAGTFIGEEGESIQIEYGGTTETIRGDGTYERREDDLLTEYEHFIGDNTETAKGKELVVNDDGTIDLTLSKLTESTLTDKEGIIQSTTHEMKDGTLVETTFSDSKTSNINIKTIQDGSIITETWQPDDKGNLVGTGSVESLRYTSEGDLQIKDTDDEWINYEDASITEKAGAAKAIAGLNANEDLNNKLNEFESETDPFKKEEIAREIREQVDQLAEQKEEEMEDVAEQAEEDQKEATKASDRSEAEKREADDAEEEKTLAQKEAEYKQVYAMMYDMTWKVLQMTLGEEVNDWIEDQCKEDSSKSYPATDAPMDGGGSPVCSDVNNNIYNGQFISMLETGDACEYKVTYGFATCNQQIAYTVQLRGTGSPQNVERGVLGEGQSLTRKRVITSQTCTHQRICIIPEGQDARCFPPEGGQI